MLLCLSICLSLSHSPPSRRLSFRQRCDESDTLLLDFYSEANGTDRETSRKILSDFISGLRETLQTRKVVSMPGLGRLRATKENTFFFIADEDLDIYPYGFGLEPVSLKTHEETPEEVSAAVEELQRITETPAAPAVPASEPVRRPSKAVKALVWTLLALVALLVAFFVISRVFPGIFDKLLYTPEELRIINYPL